MKPIKEAQPINLTAEHAMNKVSQITAVSAVCVLLLCETLGTC